MSDRHKEWDAGYLEVLHKQGRWIASPLRSCMANPLPRFQLKASRCQFMSIISAMADVKIHIRVEATELEMGLSKEITHECF